MAEVEDKQKYLKIAVSNITPDTLLDAWWDYLATNTLWIGSDSKKRNLRDLNAAYLFNIRNLVLRLASNSKKSTPGADRLIGLISRLMAEKAASLDDDDPFDDMPK